MLKDSPQKYSKFIDCLFATNQTAAALVTERGGVAMKVHINNGKATKTREFEMKFIERFQRMQTENTLILNDMLNTSVEKLLNDVCILHAKQNKGIELWFWCKTETSLNQLKGLSDDDLREIIQRMYQRLIPEHSTSLKPQFIQLDYSLASDVAERQLSIRHVGDIENLIGLDVNFSRMAQSSKCVSSLADKIYIAQNGKIFVYENKHPYRAAEPIVFDLALFIASPVSIASCNTNKCLYIPLAGNGIFKVEPEFENRVSRWMNKTEVDLHFLSISVTGKGDVFVLQVESGGPMLLIFTPEGTVKRAISMENPFTGALFIQEIIPNIVAFSFASRYIAIMNLDDNGTKLRHIECQEEIVGLTSFRYGDLLIGVFQFRHAAIKRGNSSDFVSVNFDEYHLIDSQLGNYESGIVHLHHGALESKIARDLLTIDKRIDCIHFAADQKQLYVLINKNLHIYQLNYEDEDYFP